MLSENLRNARKKRKYNTKELSELSGVSVATIENIESGRNKNPGIQAVIRLSKALKIAVSTLIK